MWRSKGEVREEGKKGLVRPAEDNVMEWDEKEREFPDFCVMLQYFYKRVSHSKYNTGVAEGCYIFHCVL